MALSAKQKKFIDVYLETLNATESARQAKYRGDDATLAAVGWENLRKPEIAKVISERLSETAMPAGEVLKRLAEHARGSLNDFVKFDDNGNATFDLQAASLMGKLHLAKKLKTKTRSWSEAFYNPEKGDLDSREVKEVTVEFELYDAQAALSLLGRHHKLFADKLDVNHTINTEVTADERAQAAKELDEWQRRKKNAAATSNG